MSAILARAEALAAQLTASIPGARVEIEEFPSGAVALSVRAGGRAWVMDYSPQRGFGVDELGPEEGFQAGYRYSSDNFDEAAEILLRLLQGGE